jgi:hypothetical protein
VANRGKKLPEHNTLSWHTVTSRQPGQNFPLIGEKLVELLLIAEQLVQFVLVGFDSPLVGEHLPLVRENLPLVLDSRPV